MFFTNYNKAGKGIDPNAPKKEGFAWFLDIFLREFWAMLYLNILFLVSCIPLVTIGASYGAMYSVLIRMVRDQPVDAFPDFKEAFAKNWKLSTKVFIVQILAVMLLFINYEFYNQVNPFLHVVVGMVAVFMAFTNIYLLVVSVSVELGLKHVIKNSFLLVFLNMKNTLICTVYFVLMGVMLIYFPLIFILYFFLGGFAITGFVTCFLAYCGIEKYCYFRQEEDTETPLSHEEEMALLDAELDALCKDEDE